MFSHIVAYQPKDRGIGKDGELIRHCKEDMEFFQMQTAGATLLMGRKTAESLPNNGRLKGRTSLVVSTTRTDLGHKTFPTVEEAIQFCKSEGVNTYVIGGESIYEATFEYCRSLFVTVFHKGHVDGADAFYPEIPERYQMIRTSGCDVQFIEYLDLDFHNSR